MKRRALLLLALQACVKAGTGPVPDDGVVLQRSTRSYSVDATSSAALNRSIREDRRRGDMRNAIGVTNSNTRWAFVTVSGPGGCNMTQVVVTVKTLVSLPRWTAPATTSGARREWWNRIQFSISQHERRHVQIAEDGGRAIAAELRGLHAMDCTTLRNNAQTAASREFNATRQRQAAFDRSDGVINIPAPPP